jgi:hypothetical protein
VIDGADLGEARLHRRLAGHVEPHWVSRQPDPARALRLEYLTVGWNVVEGVVSVGAALAAGSVAPDENATLVLSVP